MKIRSRVRSEFQIIKKPWETASYKTYLRYLPKFEGKTKKIPAGRKK
jgi:hypothetical protein